MKFHHILFVFLLGLWNASCSEDTGLLEDSNETISLSDQETIDAIDNDFQLKVASVDVLPGAIQTQIKNEFTDRYIWSVAVSESFGFKVGMEKVAEVSDQSSFFVYFNKEGRKLKNDPRDTPESTSSSCIEIQFPLTYILPDGSTVTGNSSEAIRSQLGDFYRGNAGTDQRPKLKFPVTVSLNGALVEVESEVDLSRLNDECDATPLDGIGPVTESGQYPGVVILPGTGESCYKLIYPVTLNLPGSEAVTANNEEELTKALTAWSADHPESKERPVLKFPFKISLGDAIMTISDESALHRVEGACDSDDGRPSDEGGDTTGEGDGETGTDDRDGRG